jgi:hypothetical protein
MELRDRTVAVSKKNSAPIFAPTEITGHPYPPRSDRYRYTIQLGVIPLIFGDTTDSRNACQRHQCHHLGTRYADGLVRGSPVRLSCAGPPEANTVQNYRYTIARAFPPLSHINRLNKNPSYEGFGTISHELAILNVRADLLQYAVAYRGLVANQL